LEELAPLKNELGVLTKEELNLWIKKKSTGFVVLD
jgi:hypothetical protein